MNNMKLTYKYMETALIEIRYHKHTKKTRIIIQKLELCSIYSTITILNWYLILYHKFNLDKLNLSQKSLVIIF